MPSLRSLSESGQRLIPVQYERNDKMKRDDNGQKRIAFLDWLRFAACFMVMAIHACEPFYLGGAAPNTTSIANRWDAIWITVTECICRVCVPLFVITSSYLLFPLKCTTGDFFRRRFTRIVVPFMIWAVAYVLWFGGDLWRLCFNFPDEGGHLWFVPMLLGLYVAMPLLSPWAERVGQKELSGWILLWLITTLFPFVRFLWGNLYGEPPFGAVPYLFGECPWNTFGMFHYVSGFIGYMLIGLWFRKFGPSLSWGRTLSIAIPTWLIGISVIGLPFFFRIPSFPYSAPYSAAVKLEMSIEYNSFGVALATIAAFLVFRKMDFRGWVYEKVVRPVSEASYGMYLIHMAVLLAVFDVAHARFSTPNTILLTAVATFTATAVVAVCVRKIPVVGRLICG